MKEDLGSDELGILEFAAYMPLFAEMHHNITEAPLSDHSRVLDAVVLMQVVRKCFRR